MAFFEGNIFSHELDLNVQIAVIIPEGIKKQENINVLFLLHGYNGSHMDWVRLAGIEKLANERRLAVVMPAATNSYYTNMKYGLNYFNYMATELPKKIGELFNLNLTKDNTYIAGLSMGGYGALKIALTYPERFKGVASLSGAVNVLRMFDIHENSNRKDLFKGIFGSREDAYSNEDIDLYKIIKRKKPENLDILFMCGKDDFLYQDNKKFDLFLKNNNIEHTFIENEGNHNWDYWSENIKLVLKHFFDKKGE
ncbi:alpha/beta hydrolase [Haploplasma axanthum]|uniref:Endo-1,4-beta-xylanase Z n=1 Tax=Haploplasma axanthum TaxID=29552 RepID=A0A449BC75_HAPAX|nr:alpha/beta hydrolase family protein [Haploplasma axanthum]VEU80038.1 Endo-1,4-beta-xylanase Z precursor [Haploplasma axanthum]